MLRDTSPVRPSIAFDITVAFIVVNLAAFAQQPQALPNTGPQIYLPSG
jgi:hypothetical protein